MSLAYVDSSCLVAIALGERAGAALARRLERFDQLCSANLLEAELRGALVRKGLAPDVDLLSWISWVLPDRALSPEIARVLAAGRLRGADLWHVACALYVAGSPVDLPFVTLDDRQQAVTKRLGFPT